MGFKTFNDRLALIYGGVILAMWSTVFVMWYMGKIQDEMPTAIALVLGATVSKFGDIVQFYFRKKETE